MKKIVPPILTILLIALVGMAGFRSFTEQMDKRQVVTVRGLIGSEKEAFFQNEEVIEALRKHQMIVEAKKEGSRKIALAKNIKEYDFVFPSGSPAAAKIKSSYPKSTLYNVFHTPMVAASWKRIGVILEKNGVAKVNSADGRIGTIDMSAFIKLAAQNKKWKELKNSEDYSVSRSVLMQSTDVRTSNSAAMYLALSSFILNNNNIVSSATRARELVPKVAPLFLRQGFQESSSVGPFEDYISMGIGKSPLVMVYEAQIIQAALEGQFPANGMILYPSPTVYAKHTLIGFSEEGKRLGELLKEDPELQKLAEKHGFRSVSSNSFKETSAAVKSKAKISLPSTIDNVIDTPAYEVLEAMIEGIEQKMAQMRQQTSMAHNP